MEAIITKTDIIEANTHVSVNIKQAVFDTAINDAQILDVRPILGAAFYLDVVTNIYGASPIPPLYADLLNGTTYVNNCGDTVKFYGLKPMIVFFAYARLISNNNNFFTNGGNKLKLTNQSEVVSTKDLQSWINTATSKAIAYQEDVISFLCEKNTDYPLYKSGKTEPRKGSILMRSSKINTRY